MLELRQLRSVGRVVVLLLAGLLGLAATPPAARAAAVAAPEAPATTRAAEGIDFTQEVLDNGLRVIYAPLRQAPVVHVRVLYHVGSRDERPDRQGFAHMFEHMMFRGSQHVEPEQHMKLIGMVGGYSNAFTSFDQTVYVNTIPANHLEMALYLEADRMASFKVSEEIYNIERNVVMEEWRRRQNTPYGTFFEDFFRLSFTRHPYQWTPIGNMDHLAAATVQELQEFFNRYYLPNNAVLVVAGDFELPEARKLVQRYFAWIPRGAQVRREIPTEPPQTAVHSAAVPRRVPLPRIAIGYHVPPYESDDHFALSLLANILGAGRSSRLEQLLVHGEDPLCVSAGASNMSLQDGGFFAVMGTVLAGRDPQRVQELLLASLAEVAEKGVSEEELEKAKTMERVSFVRNRRTAEDVASQLGHEALIGGDAARVNEALARLEAVTVADVRAVARKYLTGERYTLLRVVPDAEAEETPVLPDPPPAPPAAQAPAVQPRVVEFPADYPRQPPMADERLRATFAKGEETTIGGVRVIIMSDHRLPSVSWGLTLRSGSHADPQGKEGLASLTAELMQRGAGDLPFAQLTEDLESRGITISISDGGDYTRLSGSCLTEQVEHGITRSRQILLQPRLPADQFANLRNQTLSSLQLAQARPQTAAAQELAEALFGDAPLGRYATPQSVASITLEDVKAFYQRIYRPNDAIFIISGDVTVQRGQELAAMLLEGWEPAQPPRPEYDLPQPAEGLRIILVDRPEGRQSMIRMASRAYDIQQDEKFAGSLAGTILSSGIDSRLGRYVRAERGLVYSVYGYFAAHAAGRRV
jgi:zinc protease